MRVGALVLLFCYVMAMIIRGFSILDPRYSFLSAGAVVSSLGVYVPFYYIEAYCTALDPNSSLIPYLLPIINASSLFGRIIGGYIADQVGHLNILYPMQTLSGFLCLAMWLPSTNPSVLVGFACLYGFTSGIFISVMPAATAQITPTEKLGGRLGAFGTVTSIAFLTGTPIAGTLIKNHARAGYQPLITFSGCSLIAGGLIILIARLLHDKDLRTKW